MGQDTVHQSQSSLTAEEIAQALRHAANYPNHPLVLELAARLAELLKPEPKRKAKS